MLVPYRLAAAVAWFTLATACMAEAPNKNVNSTQGARVVSSRMIWDAAPHNAFTDLTRWKDRWYCSFREGSEHASYDGKVRILSSADGEKWESVAQFAEEGRDLRDPKLCVLPDGRLLVGIGVRTQDKKDPRNWHTVSRVSITDDGHTWVTRNVGDPQVWMWRFVSHEEYVYSFGYRQRPKGLGGETFLNFYRSRDGLDWERITQTDGGGGYVNEAAFVFRPNDECVVLLRREGGNNRLGQSLPPYTDWTWTNLDDRFNGPALVQFPDGRLLVGGRTKPAAAGSPKTSLAWLETESPRLEPLLTLPSQHETGYPGLYRMGDELWTSYYSSESGKSTCMSRDFKSPASRNDVAPGKKKDRGNAFMTSSASRVVDPSRREFLCAGLNGLGSLSLPSLLRLRAASAAADNPQPSTAVILVWLRGGCSHLDTYDPKPEASSDYRGPFATIETRTPGLLVSELIPRQARISDKFSVLRSMNHTGGGHPSGSLQMLTGDTDAQDKPKPVFPDFMTVAHALRKDRVGALPNYVGVNPVTSYDGFQIAGSAYLGPAYEPFAVTGDPSTPTFQVPNVGLADVEQLDRLRRKVTLRTSLDRFRRTADSAGVMDAMDQFEAQALGLLTSSRSAEAFDLTREDEKIRDRYGRHSWGQQCLMARRLVEAGVEIVTTTFDGPLCGRVSNWDDHAVNHHVFDAMAYRAPYFDQAVSALIEDIYDRGLDQRVLVIVTGEFGRTPRISYVASSGEGQASAAAGIVQPGRDHWPNANSMIWAGGGIRTEQVIGSTDARGEEVIDRRVGPQDFLATIYQHLGIDYRNATIPDHTGRPTPIVTNGAAVQELMRAT